MSTPPALPSRPAAGTDPAVPVEAIQRLTAQRQAMVDQLGRAIIGQREVIENVLLTLFAGGHTLITGVPGLAKTLLIRSLGRAVDLGFSRIQFTPDLMPSDITGTVTPACVGVPSEPDYNPTVTVGIYPIRSGVGPVVGTRFTGTCGSPVSVALPTQTWGSLDSITVAVQQADCGTAACTSLPQNLSFSLRGDGSGAAVGAL
jgi:hypothetical protein